MSITVVIRHVAGPYDGRLGLQQCSRCGFIVADFQAALAQIREPLLYDMTRKQPTVAELRKQIRPFAVGQPVTVLCGTDCTVLPPFINCTPVHAPHRRYFLGETSAYA